MSGQDGGPRIPIELLTQELRWTSESDGYLYHATSVNRLARILREGFRFTGRSIAGRGGGYEDHSIGRIFFSERPGASFWQERIEAHLFDQYDDPPDVVVLRVPRSALDRLLQEDPLGSEDARSPSYFVDAADLEDVPVRLVNPETVEEILSGPPEDVEDPERGLLP